MNLKRKSQFYVCNNFTIYNAIMSIQDKVYEDLFKIKTKRYTIFIEIHKIPFKKYLKSILYTFFMQIQK